MIQDRRNWIEALRLLLDLGSGEEFGADSAGNSEQLSRIVWLPDGQQQTSPDREFETSPGGEAPAPSRRSRAGRSSKSHPRLAKKSSTKEEPRIKWGRPQEGGPVDLPSLVGVEDAYEHTPLLAGERVAVCTRDQVAYHLNTWQFLKTYNRGCCCACGRGDKILLVTLPGVYLQPAAEPVYVPAPWVSGEKVISLPDVAAYIGRAVVIEDYVYNVHRSQKGTYFIKFQPTGQAPRPFDGFKVVIFNALARNWERSGIDPYSYAQHIVRVRGVIRQHDAWGIEILVSSPRLIQVIDESKQEG
jgi:hypothetical protein